MMHISEDKPTSAAIETFGVFFQGQSQITSQPESLHSPFNNQHFADVCLADDQMVEDSIEQATHAFEKTRHLSSHERCDILKTTAALIRQEKRQLAEGITRESGKPITAALAEIDRTIFTFEVAAEEALRIHGEIIQLDWLPGNEKRHAEIRRQAKGVIVGITPFNFPMNLVAHKIAPALAAGNPIIIKPALQTAVSALKLGRIIAQAGWPEAAIAVLPCHNDTAKPLISDERVQLLSFTGSPKVGWHLKSLAGKKAVTLELGGNAGNIVEPDVDLDKALDRLVWGGFINSGQACISVQRIYIHADIYDEAKRQLIEKVQNIVYGDPWSEETVVGPVINQAAADKIEHCIKTAVEGGAEILVGGNRQGLVIEPTLLENDDESLAVSAAEIFGPVIVMTKYDQFRDAIARVNQSAYGLQAGVFTNDLQKINFAIDSLEVGGVNINDVSTFRIDHMPYGGLKSSGCGREGLKYAIEEMTNMKLITYNNAF